MWKAVCHCEILLVAHLLVEQTCQTTFPFHPRCTAWSSGCKCDTCKTWNIQHTTVRSTLQKAVESLHWCNTFRSTTGTECLMKSSFAAENKIFWLVLKMYEENLSFVVPYGRRVDVWVSCKCNFLNYALHDFATSCTHTLTNVLIKQIWRTSSSPSSFPYAEQSSCMISPDSRMM